MYVPSWIVLFIDPDRCLFQGSHPLLEDAELDRATAHAPGLGGDNNVASALSANTRLIL